MHIIYIYIQDAMEAAHSPSPTQSKMHRHTLCTHAGIAEKSSLRPNTVVA